MPLKIQKALLFTTLLVPTIETILRLPSTMDDTSNALQPQESQLNTSFNLDDIDDEELDSYIMSDKECQVKKDLWHVQNADYLRKQTGKFPFVFNYPNLT